MKMALISPGQQLGLHLLQNSGNDIRGFCAQPAQTIGVLYDLCMVSVWFCQCLSTI